MFAWWPQFAGRPVLASVDEGTEVVRVVEATGAGIAVAPDDADAFAAGLSELLAQDRAAMGQQGRAFVEEWVSPAGVATAYIALFEELRE